MHKLKFEFKIKAGEDPKTNVMCITSITTQDNHSYAVPERFQPITLHENISKTEIFKKVKSTLLKRHEKRQVWIPVTSEIKDKYVDEEGNIHINGYFLEEIVGTQAASAGISEEALSKILKNFADIKKDTCKSQTVKGFVDKFVISKFNHKTSNASQWLNIFESECIRLEIEDDIKKIEAFRLFLDDSCVDWYSSMLIKYTINSEWQTWKENFCETYADKGWSPIRYAIQFKFRQGSLLEYALKKERLLLEVNKSMDRVTMIDLIATGLPNFVADRIDRNNINETKDLFNIIRGLEHLVKKNYTEKRLGGIENKIKDTKLPCKICEKQNKRNRYHPEALCWFNDKKNDQQRREQIKNVNNTELETELNEINPKNL